MRYRLARYVLLCWLLLPAALAWGQDQARPWPPPRVPLESLFTGLTNDLPRLSPDGRRVAWVREGGPRAELFLLDTDLDQPPRRRWPLPVATVRQMQWTLDGARLLLETPAGLLIVEPEGGDLRRLPAQGDGETQVVSLRGPRPGEVLLAMPQPGGRAPHLFACDLASGHTRLLARNRVGAVSWWVDSQGGALAALRPRRGGGAEVLASPGLGRPFRRLLRLSALDRPVEVVGFAQGGEELLVLAARGGGPLGLEALRMGGGRGRVIFRHERHDVDEVLFDPASGRVAAVRVMGQRAFWVGQDQETDRQLRRLAGWLAGDLSVADYDGQGRFLVLKETSGDGPPRFVLHDRQGGGLRHLFPLHQDLEGHAFGPMGPLTFRARDGLELYGYLILPPGAPPTPLPLVIRVHAGPWSRHLFGFSLEGQWLANLGLAVLHLNYRGSTGFGQAYLDAGDRQWGGQMLTDLLDARDQLVARGVADPRRVAILGSSYGGYAALMALAMHPREFAGGVTFAAPSDLVSLLPVLPRAWRPVFHQRLGRLPQDREFLRRISPLTHAGRIIAPLLMAHGAQDPVVPLSQGQAMAQALGQAGREVSLRVYDGEGHHLEAPENRLRFYREAEAFLIRCLGLEAASPAAAGPR